MIFNKDKLMMGMADGHTVAGKPGHLARFDFVVEV